LRENRFGFSSFIVVYFERYQDMEKRIRHTYKNFDILEQWRGYTVTQEVLLDKISKACAKVEGAIPGTGDDSNYFYRSKVVMKQLNYATHATRYYWRVLKSHYQITRVRPIIKPFNNCWVKLLKVVDFDNTLEEGITLLNALAKAATTLGHNIDKLNQFERLALNFMLDEVVNLDLDMETVERIVEETKNENEKTPYHLGPIVDEALSFVFCHCTYEGYLRARRRRIKCECCLRPESLLHPMKRCVACRLVSYCSVSCQKEHWKTHKTDCKNEQRKREEKMKNADTDIDVTVQPVDNVDKPKDDDTNDQTNNAASQTNVDVETNVAEYELANQTNIDDETDDSADQINVDDETDDSADQINVDDETDNSEDDSVDKTTVDETNKAGEKNANHTYIAETDCANDDSVDQTNDSDTNDLKDESASQIDEDIAADLSVIELKATQLRQKCWRCHKNKSKRSRLIRCPNCAMAKYCSDACLDKDSESHKTECKAWHRHMAEVD